MCIGLLFAWCFVYVDCILILVFGIKITYDVNDSFSFSVFN